MIVKKKAVTHCVDFFCNDFFYELREEKNLATDSGFKWWRFFNEDLNKAKNLGQNPITGN
jgi:hypothetical protein